MMHKVLGVCVVVLMLTGLGRAEAPQLPSVDGLNAGGLELVWHAQVSLDVQRDAVQEMAFDGETLFLQTNRGIPLPRRAAGEHRRTVVEVVLRILVEEGACSPGSRGSFTTTFSVWRCCSQQCCLRCLRGRPGGCKTAESESERRRFPGCKFEGCGSDAGNTARRKAGECKPH